VVPLRGGERDRVLPIRPDGVISHLRPGYCGDAPGLPGRRVPMSRNARLVLLGLAVVVIVVAAILLSGGGSSSTQSAGPATIEVKDAKPVGGVKDLTYNKGDTIDLTIKSDTADEVHFHGYDVHKDVSAGGTVNFTFPAKIDGEFVVELEDHKQTLANVTVEP
jgi:hypothetical protein